MKRTPKTFVALLLAVLMVASCLPACALAEEKMEISYYGMWAEDLQDGSYCEKLIEDALNVDVKTMQINTSSVEQVNLMLASGEMPDFGWYDKTVEFMHDEELARTIPVEMVKKYAPSFIAAYDEMPVLYTQTLSKSDPTQFEYLTGVHDSFGGKVYISSDFYRYDWIKALGIDLGVEVTQIDDRIYAANAGISTEKFAEILNAFTNKDPDGNGKNDTIGMSTQGVARADLMWSGFNMISGANNLDGKTAMNYAMPQYKDAIKFFRGLYADGLIDKEWLTQSRDQAWEKCNSGYAGYWHESTIAFNPWASDRPPLSLLAANPTAEILVTPGLASSDGKVYMRKECTPARGSCFINRNVSDEKLAKILEILEYVFNGPQLYSFHFGEENVDWKMEDGKVTIINALKGGEKGTRVFSEYFKHGDMWKAQNASKAFLDNGKQFWIDDGIWNQYLINPYKQDLKSETDYEELSTEYSGDLKDVVAAYFMDCILGKKDVDTSWDAYMEELNRNGYQKMMDELDKLPTVDEILADFQK
ncbi:MAG: hypothetical protein RR653_02630 [Clostridia bacterium]